jgi:ATP-dependent helicase/nuclease subunit A
MTQHSTPYPDDSEVRRAATDPARSVLLQAPAGSGKTTVLIQRYLRLLARVDAPEQVLAITFTRKAAGEMRARIMAALGPTQPPRNALEAQTQQLALAALEHSRRCGWQLESNPARLRIQTLDALNQRLAASLPVAARLGGGVEITDDAEPLYERAATLALRHAEQDAALAAHSGLWLERVGNDWRRLETLLAELLARRNHWLRHVSSGSPQWLRERVGASLQALVRDEVAAIRDACDPAWLGEGRELARGATAVLQSAAREVPPAWDELDAGDGLDAAVRELRAVAALALTQKGEPRRSITVTLGFPADSPLKPKVLAWLEFLAARPDSVDALRRAGGLPDATFSDIDITALESLVVLLQYAAAELTVVFAEQNQVDHAAMGAAARQALGIGDDSAPAALDDVDLIQHVLVDEFQDTSIEQFELLEGLVRNWQPGESRSLFLVGDPMQSIYQFREAEVALFMRARDHGIAHWRLEPMALRRNFRSAPAIVAFVNETFARVFPRIEDRRSGAVSYHPSIAAGGEGVLPAVVHLHRVPPGDRAAEASLVLAQVRAVRSQAPQASIAILVAGRAHAVPITAALRAAQIPVRGVDLVPLRDVPAVQDLIALTRAMLSPRDRIAWLAVLRAPWCGLSLPDLTAFVGRDPDAPIPLLLETLPDAPQPDAALSSLQRVARAYRAAQSRLPDASLAARLESWWLQLGGPLCGERETDAADTDAYLVALREAERRRPIVAAADVERVVERLFAAPGAGEGAVEVMTIHRSKGLEFDCVILPGLARAASGDRDPLLDWFEWSPADRGTELVMAPIRAASEAPSRLAVWLQQLRRRRRDHERARLLYVATTRARRALHLACETPAACKDGSPGAPRSGTPLATLWPALGDRVLAVAEQGGTGAPTERPGPQVLRRLSPAWTLPPWPPGVLQPARPVATEPVRAAVEFSWVGDTARRVGIVVHAELQRWARAGSPPEPDSGRLRRLLIGEGVADVELEPAVERVVRALQGTRGDPRGRWLVLDAHDEACSELALTGQIDGRLQSIVIDRSFVDADGQRWVIDYKTSIHEGGDLDGFIANEVRRYRGQLERYARFARELGPQPVRIALYFPLLARFVEVDA